MLQTTGISSEEVHEITVLYISQVARRFPQMCRQAISHSLLIEKIVDAQSKIATLCKKKGYAMYLGNVNTVTV